MIVFSVVAGRHEKIQNRRSTQHHRGKRSPGDAIYKDTRVFEDGSQQHINYCKCAMPFSEPMECSVCIKECTFFRIDYDKIEAKFIKSRQSSKKQSLSSNLLHEQGDIM